MATWLVAATTHHIGVVITIIHILVAMVHHLGLMVHVGWVVNVVVLL